METNTSSSIKQLVIPVALIFGFARIVLDLIPKIAGAHSKVYYATFLIAFVFEIIVITYLIQKYKKQQQNSLALSEALVIGVMFMIIVGALYAIQSLIFDIYIDPDYQKNIALEWANLYGKEQDIQNMIADGQGLQKTNAIFSIFTSVLKFSLLGISVSFIVGSITRTK